MQRKSDQYESPRCAADIEDQITEWYVDNLLPKTGLVLVVGPAGFGKSTVTFSILADISSGRVPLSHSPNDPHEVLILSREEMPPAIKARLQGLDATLQRVLIASDFDLRDGVMYLRQQITRGISAIIIDSLTAFTEGNLNSRREMFGTLDSLRRIAEPKHNYPGALILLIHHTNSRSGSISDRIAGSKAIAGVVRHALHVGVHPFNDEQRVLSVCKSNIGPLNVNRAFSLNPFACGEELDTTASELIGGSEDNATRAVRWLQQHMRPGMAEPAADLFKAAGQSRGLSRRSLQRAACFLNIDTDRIGFGGNVFWTMPGSEEDDSRVSQQGTLFLVPKGGLIQ